MNTVNPTPFQVAATMPFHLGTATVALMGGDLGAAREHLLLASTVPPRPDRQFEHPMDLAAQFGFNVGSALLAVIQSATANSVAERDALVSRAIEHVEHQAALGQPQTPEAIADNAPGQARATRTRAPRKPKAEPAPAPQAPAEPVEPLTDSIVGEPHSDGPPLPQPEPPVQEASAQVEPTPATAAPDVPESVTDEQEQNKPAADWSGSDF